MDGPGEARRSREVLRRFLLGDDNLDQVLAELASEALATVASTDLASITVVRSGKPTTPACTDSAALALDEAQYDHDDGPCLAAMRHVGVEEVTVGTDGRWPPFEAAAADLGVTSSLSVPLLADDEAVGALNLYSRTTDRFTPDSRDSAVQLAAEIGIAVANVVRYDEAANLARQLQTAMESRAVIEQAKGVLMGAQHCSPEAAFEMLRRASQRENRKLRDIAADIVDRAQHGAAPPTA